MGRQDAWASATFKCSLSELPQRPWAAPMAAGQRCPPGHCGSESIGDAVRPLGLKYPPRTTCGPPDHAESETGYCPVCASGMCCLIARKFIRMNRGFW